MINNGEIIEDYPDDKYGASCLICGFTMVNRPLHLHCSYPSRPILKIITLYQPKDDKYLNKTKSKDSLTWLNKSNIFTHKTSSRFFFIVLFYYLIS